MTALSIERRTPELNGSAVLPKVHSIKVKAATKILAGALVAIDSTGYLVNASEATGLIACGVADETCDNTSGSSGDKRCRVLSGVFKFKNSSSSDAIAQANLFGLCYAADNQTVALTSNSGARSVAGIVFQIDSDGVYVLVMPPGAAAGLGQLEVETVELHKLADAAAATATAETAFYRAPSARTIVGVYFVADAAVTASDADYATATVKRRDGAGGAAATVASIATTTAGSGNITAFVPKSLGTITNAALAAGNVLTLTIAKTGNGVQLPAGQWVVVTRLG
jgi:hypothetical protein